MRTSVKVIEGHVFVNEYEQISAKLYKDLTPTSEKVLLLCLQQLASTCLFQCWTASTGPSQYSTRVRKVQVRNVEVCQGATQQRRHLTEKMVTRVFQHLCQLN